MTARSVTIIDDERRAAQVTDGALAVASMLQLQVRRGYMFNISEHELALRADASLEILFVTGPAAKETNIIWHVSLGGDGMVHLYEGTTVSAAGAALTLFNRNRRSSALPTSVVTLGPTVTDLGTELHAERISGGTGGTASGFSAAAILEWLLKPDERYMLRLHNTTRQRQLASMGVLVYEVPYELTPSE